jgi:hypothetical protein
MNQPEHPNTKLAYHDEHVLDSDEARPLRILAEYLEPLRAFQRERIHDTIVFFGSARLGTRSHPASSSSSSMRHALGSAIVVLDTGSSALEALAHDRTDILVGFAGGDFCETPLAEIVGRAKPIDPAAFELARVLAR